MESTELYRVTKNIIIFAILLAVVSAFSYAHFVSVTSASQIFLFLGLTFMCAHWLLLASFISLLGRMNAAVFMIRGFILLLPAFLSLALVFIAGKIGSGLIVPAAIGVISLPVAATLYGMYKGFSGCLIVPGREGCVRD